jgi:large subunit ribosomal protein L18Ae
MFFCFPVYTIALSVSDSYVLSISQIFEKNSTTIKNFGIWLRYQSRTRYYNMYKEYRDMTLNGAVDQMYTEMASRHPVRSPCILIIKTATVDLKLCKRDTTKQFHNSKIRCNQFIDVPHIPLLNIG